MSTRSTIAFVAKDGKVKSSYCHWDGYVSNNGAILLVNYEDPQKIIDLLSFGDISTLKKSVFPNGNTHSYKTPEEGVTVFYGRDRGEEIREKKFASFEKYSELCDFQEYNYVFFEKKNKWYLYDPYKKKLTTLASEVKAVKSDLSGSVLSDYKHYLKEKLAKKNYEKMKKELSQNSSVVSVKPKI